MKRKATLKGFTLIEMLIVIVIIGILAVVLIESYLTISKTALRIEQEKNISEESLILTQVFQAISDEATIDYERYKDEGWNFDSENGGFTGTLYLTGGQWSGTSIYTTGDCLDLDGNFMADENGNINQVIQDYTGCSLVLEQDGDITQITTPGKVVISNVMFKIIPYDSDENYFNGATEGQIVMNDVHQPGFWMFIHLYAPLYQPIGINRIELPLQLFFNLNL